jgi:hypothetical protein
MSDMECRTFGILPSAKTQQANPVRQDTKGDIMTTALATPDRPDWFDSEPTFADLDAIEIEWPSIERDLADLERVLGGPAPERFVAFDIARAFGDTLADGFPTFSLS